MCNRLGKKHPNFSNQAEAMEKLMQRKDRHGRPMVRRYTPHILDAWSKLRDKFMHPFQDQFEEGRMRPSIRAYYLKLDKYYNRSTSGKDL